MPNLVKRGKRTPTWYSDFPIHRYGPSGEILRRTDGAISYTRIRWPLDTDKEIASEKQTELLKIRREANEKGIDFKRHYRARRSEAGGKYLAFRTSYLSKRKTEFSRDTYSHDERAFREMEKAAEELTPPVVLHDLSHLNPRFLDRVRTHWITLKKSPSAINRALRSIKQAMREAAGFGEMLPHDWKIVKNAKGENEHRTFFFTIQQVRTQVRRMPPGCYKSIAFLGNRNGRRLGECYYLPWAGVNFKQNTIANQKIEGVWAPKSKTSYLPVPMSQDLRAYLWKLKKTATDQWVIPAKGKPTLDVAGLYYKRYLRKFKIPKGSVHTCRHTFASHLVQQGCDIYSVSKLMRHSSIKQTEHYAHLRPPDLEKAVQGLPRL